MQDPLGEWISSLIGQPLTRAVAVVYEYAGTREYDNLIALWLHFGDGAARRLKLGPDGLAMWVDDAVPEPIDLGEYGQCAVEDITQRKPWQHIVGTALTSAHLLFDRRATGARSSGLCLQFDALPPVYLVNYGDDFKTWEQATFDDLGRGEFCLVAVPSPG